MPTVQLSQAMLLDQGLSARPLLVASMQATSGLPTATVNTDIVGAFKQLIAANQISNIDPGLISVVATASNPINLATYFINAKYAALGGASGFLGATTTAVAATPGGAGFVRRFQNGSIYWHPQAGAHELHGPIAARWQALGGDKSFLGFPTTDVTTGSDVRAEGTFAHFQGGSIYWAPVPQVLTGGLANSVLTGMAASAVTARTTAMTTPIAATPLATSAGASAVASATPSVGVTSPVVASPVGIPVTSVVGNVSVVPIADSSAGAYEVHGDIREKYLALGAEASILGYPRTDETGTPDGVGRFNHFQGGSIYWTPGTFAHEVHGLIRDRWSTLGWERNPQLGYPISDELIPDERVGHRRPETIKKPIVALPADVIKLPAEAQSAGFPTTVVNTPVVAAPIAPKPSAPVVTAAPSLTVRTPVATTPKTALSSPLGRLSDKVAGVTPLSAVSATSAVLAAATTTTPVAQPINVATVVNPAVLIGILNSGPASTPAADRSVNRFADFESGVLFWFRGSTTATSLTPLTATSDGTSVSFTGADIANAAISKIGRAAFESASGALASVTFIGTTGYTYDGAQTHNRRHRLQIILGGIENQSVSGPLGVQIMQPVGVTATIELQVEVWFEASLRRISLSPTDWSLQSASSGSYATTISASLRRTLDPLLWTSYELVTLPDTDGGKPIAVLSVKTLANGAVTTYIEPHTNPTLVLATSEIANSVAPSVIHFSQPS